MQAQTIPGLWDILFFWMFTGSGLLGLPPGEMDQALVRAVPPQTLVYFEWAGRGPGQAGATGIDGFAADLEIQKFFQDLDAVLADFEQRDPSPLARTHRDMLQLINPLTAHPGCLFIGFEPQVKNGNAIGAWLDILKGVHGGMIFSTGSDTEKAWQKLMSILSDSYGVTYDPTAATQQVPLSIPGYQLLVHHAQGRIIFAVGEGTLERTLEGLTGKLPGLETNQRFVESLGKVGVPRVSTVGWIDGKGLVDTVTTAMGPLGGLVRPMLQMVRIDAIDRTIYMSGVDNGTMVQRAFINTGGRTDGVLVLLAGQPIRVEQYSHIPADADMVFATSASLSNVFHETRRTLATAQPLSVRVFDEAIKQFEKDLQLKIVEDVLPAFGDMITVFDSPAAGGMIASSLVASVEIRDSQRAAIVFERVLRMIDQSLAPNQNGNANPNGELVAMRRQEFLGYTYFYVNGDPHQGPRPTAPSLCLTDHHLFIAIHPQALKAQLRHLRSNGPGFVPKNPGGAPAPTGDVMLYGYVNGPRVHSLAAAAAPFIAQDIVGHLQRQSWPLDASSIPSAAAVVPYFGDSSIVATRQADGVSIVTKNAPPVVATLGILTAYREWKASSMDAEMVPSSGIGDEVQFSPPEGQTKTASHEEPAPAAKPTQSPYRKFAPIFFRAFVPEGVQQMIPEETIRNIENGPSDATLQRREDLRKQRELRREELRRRRGGLPPAPVPAPAPAPQPDQP